MKKQKDLSKRQVLSVIGNRYVVFGPVPGIAQDVMFDPEIDASVLPRVADETDFSPERLIQSLRVFGMDCSQVMGKNNALADLIIADDMGRQIFVEVKIRAHKPKLRDLNSGYDKIRMGRAEGQEVEVWHFNTERLTLSIQAFDNDLPLHCELPPVDVWEKTEDGIFRREKVVSEVARWERSINEIYEDVASWCSEVNDLKTERSRTVIMSEELMQKFAVSDRELPILDVLKGGEVLASFVPRGLWLIGAWGRIDVITSTQTRMLVMLRDDNGCLEWRIVSPGNRRETQPLTKEMILSLLEVA